MNFCKLAVAAAATLTLNAVSATTLPVNDFFNWIEKTFPGSFPKGSATAQIDFQGCRYDYRYYGNSYFIGVCQGDGHIYSYRSNTGELIKYYPVDNHKCDARPDLCAPPSFAGTLMFSQENTGVMVAIAANYRSGKLWGVGADNQGFDIPVGEIEALCAHSTRLANFGKSTGPGCSKPQANGELRVAGLPSNDCSRFTAWWKGKEYWFDIGTPTGYQFTGLNAKLNTGCGIEYGPNGFTPAKVYAVREADGTASLVWDLGSNFVSGFGQEAFDQDPNQKREVYLFVLNGEHQGKDYGSGWGLGEGRKTKDGWEIQPSIRLAWLETDPKTGNRVIKFRNLACADQVNATTYVGTGPADKVVYDNGKDGFGRAWASVGGEAPFWTAGPGVSINTTTSQVRYGVFGCKQP